MTSDFLKTADREHSGLDVGITRQKERNCSNKQS